MGCGVLVTLTRVKVWVVEVRLCTNSISNNNNNDLTSEWDEVS